MLQSNQNNINIVLQYFIKYKVLCKNSEAHHGAPIILILHHYFLFDSLGYSCCVFNWIRTKPNSLELWINLFFGPFIKISTLITNFNYLLKLREL